MASNKKYGVTPVDHSTGTFGDNPNWQQQWANAYSALNPTWTPPAAANAALPNPITPVKFDPMNDPGYAAIYNSVQTNDASAQAQHDYNAGSIAQQYGYDASGNVITSGPNLNPYAVAAVLKRNYDNSVRGTTNNYASQGQLYAGSLINAQNANQYNYSKASDAASRAAKDAYNANDNTLANAQNAGASQLAGASGTAFQNFLGSQGG